MLCTITGSEKRLPLLYLTLTTCVAKPLLSAVISLWSGSAGKRTVGNKRERIARFGNFEVDLHARELHRNGVRLHAEEEPLKVLELLLKNPGEVVSREALHEKLWPDTTVTYEQNQARRGAARCASTNPQAQKGPRVPPRKEGFKRMPLQRPREEGFSQIPSPAHPRTHS
jgi:Transcriptional regulatory protein, C terminal